MNFVFDLDGTICFDGKRISPIITNAIHTLQQQGHRVIFASARPIRDMLPVIPKSLHQCTMVGGNGTYLYDNKKITTNALPEATIEQVQQIIEDKQLTYLADGEWDYTYTGHNTHQIYKNISKVSAKNKPLHELKPICKIVLFGVTQQLVKELAELPASMNYYAKEFALDISAPSTSKAVGLQQLQVEEFIAFGNDVNDQSMFENSLYSVCVGVHPVSTYADLKITKDDVAATIVRLGASSIDKKTRIPKS